jgi:hypothetical protein
MKFVKKSPFGANCIRELLLRMKRLGRMFSGIILWKKQRIRWELVKKLLMIICCRLELLRNKISILPRIEIKVLVS